MGRDTLMINFPPAPGTPPEGAALKRERIVFFERSGPRGAYLTTPPTCPGTGQWVNTLTYTYRDGVTQQVTSPSPCIAPSHRTTAEPRRPPLRVAIRGVPRRCARRTLAARIRVTGGARLARVRLSVDHHRIRASHKRRIAVRLRVRRLRRGRHLLKAVASDTSGARAVGRTHFRRC